MSGSVNSGIGQIPRYIGKSLSLPGAVLIVFPNSVFMSVFVSVNHSPLLFPIELLESVQT